MNLLRNLALFFGVLLLSSCGSEADISLSLRRATWLSIDLTTGRPTPLAAAPDLRDPVWRRNRMLLRAITVPPVAVADDSWRAAGESSLVDSGPKFFIGVYEMTQQQWQVMGGGTPWTAVPAGTLAAGADGPDLPAYGIDRSSAERMLSAAPQVFGGWHLPTPAQWEAACRAGSTGRFAWGDAPDPAIAGRFAHASETAGSIGRHQTVGGLTANQLDLFDTHGNIAELDAAGNLRGGSWADTIPALRCGIRVPIEADSAHVLAGVRAVFIVR
ncbi:hypothetical protein LBMAG53_06900 [Planctomycetota bacterium]|nr:hypothetical protein LBMAG53_06900 [Planctomycetota bacterium]